MGVGLGERKDCGVSVMKRCLRMRLRSLMRRFVLFAPRLPLSKGREHCCEGSLHVESNSTAK